MLRGGNDVEFGFGMCEFYERRWRELAGEVWVDVLHLFSPCLWAFPVKNAPLSVCKKIRHFLRWADIGGDREIMIISRDIFPIWIHSEKFPVKTPTHIFSQQYYRFSIIPIYYSIYTHIISDIQSLFRVHIAVSVHYMRTL